MAPIKLRKGCIDRYHKTNDISHIKDLWRLYIFYADPLWLRNLKVWFYEMKKTASVAALAVINIFLKIFFNVILTLEDD